MKSFTVVTVTTLGESEYTPFSGYFEIYRLYYFKLRISEKEFEIVMMHFLS